MVDVSFSQAAGAYGNMAKFGKGATDADDAATGSSGGGSSFVEALSDAFQSARDTQYSTEAKQMDALSGQTDLTDLVTAVANAELTLTTVVAVRDRVISAYQEIMRMPM